MKFYSSSNLSKYRREHIPIDLHRTGARMTVNLQNINVNLTRETSKLIPANYQVFNDRPNGDSNGKPTHLIVVLSPIPMKSYIKQV
ncbi:hypothetical protein [Flavobacterium poyangense]|uniref:hypothetical protein n=1 Tax=Flavobacterium poyangense TaxID=2204302 RepID=UPI0014243846|nr:hypothetical protein [Flavobacterium sp. JXAS1]